MQSSLQIYPGQQTRQVWFETLDGCGCRNKVLIQRRSLFRKNKSILDEVSVSTSVVMKVISPLFGRGNNVTCENYFTSLDLSLRLVHKRCSIVKMICRNQREVPEVLKTTKALHKTVVLKSTRSTAVTITTYQCKSFKSVSILNTFHPYVTIPEKEILRKRQTSFSFTIALNVEFMY